MTVSDRVAALETAHLAAQREIGELRAEIDRLRAEGGGPKATTSPDAPVGLAVGLISGATVHGYRLRVARVGERCFRCYVEQHDDSGWRIVWAGARLGCPDAEQRVRAEAASAALALIRHQIPPDPMPHEDDT